jgi:hypothetical protein
MAEREPSPRREATGCVEAATWSALNHDGARRDRGVSVHVLRFAARACAPTPAQSKYMLSKYRTPL